MADCENAPDVGFITRNRTLLSDSSVEVQKVPCESRCPPGEAHAKLLIIGTFLDCSEFLPDIKQESVAAKYKMKTSIKRPKRFKLIDISSIIMVNVFFYLG